MMMLPWVLTPACASNIQHQTVSRCNNRVSSSSKHQMLSFVGTGTNQYTNNRSKSEGRHASECWGRENEG